ncbi:MAG TPA: S9 family peptidase [Povalibacter sp.]|nr:S9 family peptidase [Povalibacter sp.]
MTLLRFSAALVAALVVVTAQAQSRTPFSVEQLVRLKRVSQPVLSPDGRTVVFTVRETDMSANRGRTDLWSLDIATKGAQPRRLTSDPQNDDSPQWSADGRYVYFISARSGSSQVWRLPLAGGESEQVTDLPLDVGSFKLAPNGAKLLVSMEVFADCADLACTTARLADAAKSAASGHVYDRIFIRHWDTWSDGRISQLFALTLENGKVQGEPVSLSGALDADVPSKPFGDATEYTFSPDSSKVVFSARIKGKSEPWSTNFDLYEVPADGGEPRNLTADNLAWDAQPVFSRDGSLLAWRAMDRPGFEADRFHVVVMDLKRGEKRALTADWDRSVDAMEFSADGKTLYATADNFGQHPLWAIDVKSGKPTMLTGPGHVDTFSVGSNEIVFALASLKSPSELYAITTKGDLRELPRINADAMANVQIGEPEQFTFAGFNDETVYGYVVKPAGFDPQKKYPLAFIIHGGPQVSYANAWSYRWNPQTYAGAGYAVVFIDFHGSPGYGQAFTDSISQDWGGKPLEDLQKGLAAALAKYPWIDADRACALGASYGGFMINWIAGNWSEPFKCLVNHDGIFDSRGMAYSTEELWFDEWEHGGPYYEVPENYEKFNPANFVAQWRVPMLVIHGGHDYRVPDTQGISTFTALQRRGIPSRLLFYPNENHWVLKPANSIQWHNEVLKWLAEWTQAEASAAQ